MMHSEFHKLISPRTVSENDYAVVEIVYTYHPMFDGNDAIAKDMIANLFKIGGMGLIQELSGAAWILKAAEDDIRVAELKLAEMKDRRRNLILKYKNGERL